MACSQGPMLKVSGMRERGAANDGHEWFACKGVGQCIEWNLVEFACKMIGQRKVGGGCMFFDWVSGSKEKAMWHALMSYAQVSGWRDEDAMMAMSEWGVHLGWPWGVSGGCMAWGWARECGGDTSQATLWLG